MPEYIIEHRIVFEKPYLKVELKNNTNLIRVQNLIVNLQSVKNVNITENKRKDITVYPSKFFTPQETEAELKLQLDSFFLGNPLDPVIKKNNLSTISDKAYFEIILEINIFGQNLEKYKSLCSKFDEEGFRDFFLPHLNSISRSYSATGETFNKIGKTDMLIQDQIGTNVFIAECKIWHGEHEYLKALDQLFERYITWRDEKTAILIFNKHNIDFSNILSVAKTATLKHRLYKSFVKNNSETSFSYIFTSPEDIKKNIKLELILFNCK